MATHQDQMSSTARDYWDEPWDLELARALVGKTRQDDPAHTWYRLPSHESFTAGCSCGWVSPEREMFDEMARDVDRHLDAAAPAGTAQPGSPTIC